MRAPTPITSAAIPDKAQGRGRRAARDRPARSLLPRAQGPDPARGRQAQATPSRRCARRSQRSGDTPLIAAMLGHALVATEDPKNFAEAKQVLKAAVEPRQPGPVRLVPARHHLRPRRRRGARGAGDRRAQQPRGQSEAGAGQRANGDEGHSAGNSGLSSRAGHRHGVARRARRRKDKKDRDE